MYGKYECFVMQMFVSCVHPVAVLNAAFCMTCSLLMQGASIRGGGGRFTVFWESWPCGPAGWLALLLIKPVDVETNAVPTTTHRHVWICDLSYKQIHGRKQISIRCNRIEHWVYLRCRYLPSTIHRYLDLLSTHKNPDSQRTQT